MYFTWKTLWWSSDKIILFYPIVPFSNCNCMSLGVFTLSLPISGFSFISFWAHCPLSFQTPGYYHLLLHFINPAQGEHPGNGIPGEISHLPRRSVYDFAHPTWTAATDIILDTRVSMKYPVCPKHPFTWCSMGNFSNFSSYIK